MWPLLEDEHGNSLRCEIDSGAETAETSADHDDIKAHENLPDFEWQIDNCELGPISKTAVTFDLPRILLSGMFLSGVQNALSGFPARTHGGLAA
jgi:hypothetical protein